MGFSKLDLLKPLELKTEQYPFRDSFVTLRALNTVDYVALHKLFPNAIDRGNALDYHVGLLSFCLVDDDGNKLFSTPQEARELFKSMTPTEIVAMAEKAVEVSGVLAKKN